MGAGEPQERDWHAPDPGPRAAPARTAASRTGARRPDARRALRRPRARPRRVDRLLPARVELARRVARHLGDRPGGLRLSIPAGQALLVPGPARRRRCGCRRCRPATGRGPWAAPSASRRSATASSSARSSPSCWATRRTSGASRSSAARDVWAAVDVLGVDGRPRGPARALRGDLHRRGLRRRAAPPLRRRRQRDQGDPRPRRSPRSSRLRGPRSTSPSRTSTASTGAPTASTSSSTGAGRAPRRSRPDYPMQLILGVFDFPDRPGPDGHEPELVVRAVRGTERR